MLLSTAVTGLIYSLICSYYYTTIQPYSQSFFPLAILSYERGNSKMKFEPFLIEQEKDAWRKVALRKHAEEKIVM